MGKRNRFEYTAIDDKGKVAFKGNVADMADYFYVVQNVIYMAWKNKSKFLGEYTLERKEVNPYVPKKDYEKVFKKACAYLNGVDGLTARQWEKRLLKDD